jgi:AcrR family transcriptional regulator
MPASPVSPVTPARPRSSSATSLALLSAARDLFGQKGFEGTTTREIGDRAGVDPALIARYFGSKADLYIAAVVAESQGDTPPAELEALSDLADAIFERTDADGLGPVTQALLRSDTPPEIRQAARAHLVKRMVRPMAADMARRGVKRPQVTAEIVASALLGINISRALGWFAELGELSREDLVQLVCALVGPQESDGSSGSSGPSVTRRTRH